MLRLREPLLLDLLAVCLGLPQDERADYKALTGLDYDPETVAIQSWQLEGPRWAIVKEDNSPLVVCGYARQRPGVHQSWYYSVPEAWEGANAREVTELTKLIIQHSLGYVHRLETICLSHRTRTLRWYETLGLHYESTMCKFGANGEDAAVYVALRKDNVL
jgi:hypothetical protein